MCSHQLPLSCFKCRSSCNKKKVISLEAAANDPLTHLPFLPVCITVYVIRASRRAAMKEGNEEARGQEKPLDLTFNSSGFDRNSG